MNRFVHHPWLLPFFGFILFAMMIYIFYHEPLMNQLYSTRSLDPFEDAAEPSPEDLDAANTNYAALLLFLQKYPARAIPFIKDMKDKLYGESCTVKPDIDFKTIAKFPNGMVFV